MIFLIKLLGIVKKQLEKYGRVVEVDEFRTSRLHATCYGELKNAYSQKFYKKYQDETNVNKNSQDP